VVVLAEGFEEIEAVTCIDVLRRAGLDVVIAGLGGTGIKGAHGLFLKADVPVEAIAELPGAVVLPGGMPGADNLRKSAAVNDLLRRMNEEGRIIAAICAAPVVTLEPTGILKGRRMTCYPGFEKRLDWDVTFVEERVVCDGNLITSRAPGTALEFALELVSRLAGGERAAELAEAMLVRR